MMQSKALLPAAPGSFSPRSGRMCGTGRRKRPMQQEKLSYCQVLQNQRTYFVESVDIFKSKFKTSLFSQALKKSIYLFIDYLFIYKFQFVLLFYLVHHFIILNIFIYYSVLCSYPLFISYPLFQSFYLLIDFYLMLLDFICLQCFLTCDSVSSVPVFNECSYFRA